MGAYNKEGQLTRVIAAAKKKSREVRSQEGGRGSNERTQSKPSNELQDSNGDGKTKSLPPETARDLAPFPLNRTFISQPVLTSKFQEHIWKLVIQDGMSVREVSASVGVEMSRVAAVVRLLEVEKEWRRIVRISFFPSLPHSSRLHDDIIKID
jgi:hypothetical protein